MSGSTFMLLLRLGFSLALVLGMIWGAAKLLRSKGGIVLRGGGSRLEIIERRQLGKTSGVAIVRVDQQVLVLGVADSRVEVLLELPDIDTVDDITVSEIGDVGDVVDVVDIPAMATSAPVSVARMSFVDTLRELTVRCQPTATRNK